jgi:hypothetical protein
LIVITNARAMATSLQGLVPAIAKDIHVHANVRGLTGARKHLDATPPSEPEDGWEDFEAQIITHPCTGESSRLLQDGADALRRISSKAVQGEDIDAIQRALAVDEVAKGLATALAQVVGHEHKLIKNLRDGVLPGMHRQPVGERLRS